jgi:hypothetical protein
MVTNNMVPLPAIYFSSAKIIRAHDITIAIFPSQNIHTPATAAMSAEQAGGESIALLATGKGKAKVPCCMYWRHLG